MRQGSSFTYTVVFAGLSLLAPPLAMAQEELSLESVILHCASVKTSDARLECFDALAVSLGSTELAAGTPEAADAPSPQAPDTQTAAAAPQSPDAPAVVTAQAAPAPRAPAADQQSRRFIVIDADSKEGKRAQRDTKMGRGEAFTAIVAAGKRNNTGRLFVQFDDGQIWREIEGSSKNGAIPKKGSTAMLEKGMFKSWWVVFDGDEKNRVKMIPYSID